jgi:ABC-type Na+ transport system ATPase subunit NatA
MPLIATSAGGAAAAGSTSTGGSVSAVIECTGLTKYYGTTCGVEDLDLRVERGMTYGFLGPNGAGKTTTIRCLLGMLKPTGGSASLLGERVVLDGAELRRRIGYVAGEVRLYERETGRWHIDYLSGLRGAKPSSDENLCERLGFDPSRPVRQLSKGNKQKLALVLGLMHDPELLMLDEPTSGLDPLDQQDVTMDVGNLAVLSGAALLLSIAIGTVSMAVSAASNDSGNPAAIVGGALAAMWLLGFLAGSVEWAEKLNPVNLFHYWQPATIINKGTADAGMWWFYGGLALVGAVAAVAVFSRRDVS